MAKDSSERIVIAATRLFAMKGYYGTSMRDIAHEVGLTVATVQQHAGSKEMLYREVFRRQYEVDHDIITTSLDSYDEKDRELLCLSAPMLRQLLKEVWKKMIDRFRDSPELVRLWTYRWLESNEINIDIDQKYSMSLYQIELETISQAQRNGIITSSQLEVLIWMSGFAWFQTGFFTGRNLIRDAGATDPFSPDSIAAFYTFLERYVDLMIQYDDSSREKTGTIVPSQ
jgi:AcrR family transcriptional regulator